MGDRYIFKTRWSRGSRVVMLAYHAQGLAQKKKKFCAQSPAQKKS